jgi:hypothetical protein
LWAAGTISAGELGDRFPIAADATNRVNWRQWTHNLRCYGLELNLPRCLDSSGERPILVCVLPRPCSPGLNPPGLLDCFVNDKVLARDRVLAR